MAQTVIIPAHNEERVLRRNLEIILDGLAQDVTVRVVCNGCTDRTAEIARSLEPRVEVLVLDRASKTDALNLAEAELSFGPRVYIDADIEISGDDVTRLISAVQDGPSCLVEPTARFDTAESSWLVRTYYLVWTALHGRESGDIGGGVLCIAADARGRFGQFPDVISDDGYVRWHFSADETDRLEEATSHVLAPRDTRSLVKIKTRSRLGAAQLKEMYPELAEQRASSSRSLAGKASRLPVKVWVLAPVYATVQLWVRARAWRLAKNERFAWERDDSSRTAG